MEKLIKTFSFVIVVCLFVSCTRVNLPSQNLRPISHFKTQQALKPVANIGVYFPKVSPGFKINMAKHFSKIHDCDGCGGVGIGGDIITGISEVNPNQVVGFVADDRVTSEPKTFWSDFALMFIKQHLRSAEHQSLQVSSWFTSGQKVDVTVPDGTYSVRPVTALLEIDRQRVMAKFYISAQFGIVKFEITTRKISADGTYIFTSTAEKAKPQPIPSFEPKY